jgi:hypothetical protein
VNNSFFCHSEAKKVSLKKSKNGEVFFEKRENTLKNFAISGTRPARG